MCGRQPARLDKAQTRLNICNLVVAIYSNSICMQQVWSLRVDVHILDHNGNLADAASLSALAALLAFRRPEVTLEAGGGGEGQQVVVHPPDVREPLPLSIHHTPLCITFASFQVGTCIPLLYLRLPLYLLVILYLQLILYLRLILVPTRF